MKILLLLLATFPAMGYFSNLNYFYRGNDKSYVVFSEKQAPGVATDELISMVGNSSERFTVLKLNELKISIETANGVNTVRLNLPTTSLFQIKSTEEKKFSDFISIRNNAAVSFYKFLKEKTNSEREWSSVSAGKRYYYREVTSDSKLIRCTRRVNGMGAENSYFCSLKSK